MRPTMCLSATLFPLPEEPMTTVVSRSGMVSEKPSRTVLAPKDLWTSWNSIMRGGRGAPVRLSQKHQRPERVQHQNRLATQDDGACRVPADTLCPAPGGEPHDATGESDGDAEARRLYETEPD